jgi:DNA polymerase-3 subunit delta'
MTFSKILGHQAVVERLTLAFQKDRIPSAYLFVGGNGVGKNTIVREYAQMINCRTHNICGTCDSCHMFGTQAHPDYIVIKPTGQFIRIGQIKQLIAQLGLKPIYAQKRVAVIHEAHRMNLESANCFLKILEEPPLDTLIVLMTTDEKRLLETIQSRCQKVVFSTLSREQLKQIYEQYFDIPEDEVPFILNYSKGSIRKEFIKKASELYNIRSLVLRVLTGLTNERLNDHIYLLEQWIKQDNQLYFIEFCTAWFRDFIYLKQGRSEGLYNQDVVDEIPDSVLRLSVEQLQWAFDLAIETEIAMKKNAAKLLALESLLIQFKQVFAGVPVI